MSENEINEKNNNENNINENNNNKNTLINGQFMLTPLESILINKTMPFGYKLDTEDNVIKSLEFAKMKSKNSNNESIHRPRTKKLHEIINYNDNNEKYFREKKTNKEDYKHITGKMTEIKKCEKCFEKLKSNEYFNYFYNIRSIGTPSLIEVENNIKNNKYKSCYDFFMDLRKIWNFYYQNNYSKPDIYQKTCIMSELSEELFKNIDNMNEDKEKKQDISHMKEKLDNIEKGIIEYKEKGGNISQKKLINMEKPMSISEKNALGNAIRNLNREQLKGIIKLLSDSKINQAQSGQSKYFEFDIDKLPIKKLRELEKYVNDCEMGMIKNRDNNQEQNAEIQRLKDDLRYKTNEKNINSNDVKHNSYNLISNNNYQNIEQDKENTMKKKKNNSESSSSSDSDSESISSLEKN